MSSTVLGEAVRNIVARLGFEHAQDIVGRSDLLMQISHQEQIDLERNAHPGG